jgi:hypothetical protein
VDDIAEVDHELWLRLHLRDVFEHKTGSLIREVIGLERRA